MIAYYVVQCETSTSPFDLDFEKTPHFPTYQEAEDLAIELEKSTGQNHWVVTVKDE
jgi:hypothetical protein